MPRYMIYHADDGSNRIWPSDYYLAGIIEADDREEAVRRTRITGWESDGLATDEPTWPRPLVQRATIPGDVIMDEDRAFWRLAWDVKNERYLFERIDFIPFYKVPFCVVTHDELRRKEVIDLYQEMLDDESKVAEIGLKLAKELDIQDTMKDLSVKSVSLTVWKPYPAYGILVVLFAKDMKEAEWLKDQN